VVTYLRLLFFPVNQNIAYDYPVFKSFFDPPVLLSFLFLSALFGLGVYMITGNRQWAIGNEIKAKSKKGDSNFIPLNAERSTLKAERLVGFGILWFFITLSVESSIIPLPMLINEYRVYLPSVGVIISTVTGVFLLKESSRSLKAKKSVLIVLILAIGVLSVAAYLRNDLWGDDIRLWEDTARKSPHRAAVHYNIGNIYRAHNMPDQAIEQYMITINLAPDYPEPHNNLGVIYEARNMPDKAMEQYLTAINLDPDYAEAHYNLGVAYQDLGMADKAMEQYLITIKLKPYYVGAHNNLGNIYKAISMPHKAMEQYLITVRLRPDGAEAHFNLGSLYYNMGQTENARRELLIGLKIKPDDQRAQQLLRAVLH
ncbi:MAG TPA: tetratricopeptide repeat protein, partial [Dissulfurispiraceae bacterium]|nr:tetratricopeptide repeat protein [Dissulfurispiraceae bacterium]